ncbi:MAG: bifunctional 4-hydroxy-2-oxoglutarate aldolase/2-dehydro-3-deoxy-phosphogluconate aldolase [Bacteroidota bacterium]
MSETSTILDEFGQAPIIGIMRNIEASTGHRVAACYQQAGLKFLEVTMNSSDVTELIPGLQSQYPNLIIGAGTVRNTKELKAAMGLGAQFIVTPILDEEVIKTCVRANLPVFPGAYTPTEIYQAWSLGAMAVKVFPANQLGAGYVKDVLAPLDEVPLVPTGGVNKDNIRSFFEAGAFGVGMGGSLLPRDLIVGEDFNPLLGHFVELREKIADFLGKPTGPWE